ncbi:MAG TPA: helix-turn-helix transcriptional regulator [Caulobacteraceae bacterium]
MVAAQTAHDAGEDYAKMFNAQRRRAVARLRAGAEDRPMLTAYRAIDAARGERISEAMRSLGMEFNCQLSHRIGVAESTLSRWRSGRPISLEHAIVLCSALQISLDHLLLGRRSGVEAGSFSAQLVKLSEIYRRLDATSRELFLRLLRSLACKTPGELGEVMSIDGARDMLTAQATAAAST